MHLKHKVSEKGLYLIKEFEGCELKAYLCSAGKPTIGYGHTKTVTFTDVRSGKTITEAEALKLLDYDLDEAEGAVNEFVDMSLHQSHFDALTAFVFNVGIANFTTSSLLRYLNKGLFAKAAKEFEKWVYVTNPKTGKKEKSNGLIRRRKAERFLFETGRLKFHF